jgi:hypothetical protein
MSSIAKLPRSSWLGLLSSRVLSSSIRTAPLAFTLLPLDSLFEYCLFEEVLWVVARLDFLTLVVFRLDRDPYMPEELPPSLVSTRLKGFAPLDDCLTFSADSCELPRRLLRRLRWLWKFEILSSLMRDHTLATPSLRLGLWKVLLLLLKRLRFSANYENGTSTLTRFSSFLTKLACFY